MLYFSSGIDQSRDDRPERRPEERETRWHRPEEMLAFPRSKAVSLLLLLLQWSRHIKDLKYYIAVMTMDM